MAIFQIINENHVSSTAVCAMAWYYALVLDQEIVGYLFSLQEIRFKKGIVANHGVMTIGASSPTCVKKYI